MTRAQRRGRRRGRRRGGRAAALPRVWGLVQAKNEADIIGIVLRHHMAAGMAGMVVFDNLSNDGTGEIARSVAGVVVIDDTDPNFDRGRKNREMTRVAASMGAEWVLTVDADELLYPVGYGSVPQALAGVQRDFVGVRVFDHVCTPFDDPGERNPVLRMEWRSRSPRTELRTVHRCVPGRDIFTPLTNQDVVVDGRKLPSRLFGGLAMRHFPVRSLEHFRTKTLDRFRMNRDTPNRPAWASPVYHEWYAAHSRGAEHFRRYFEERIAVSADRLTRDGSEWVRDPFRVWQ